MNKKILLIFLVLFIFIGNVKALEFVNPDTNYKAIVEDDADLLTQEEEQKLLDQITELTTFGNIGFKSTDSNYRSAPSFAESYYKTTFGLTSGSLFLIDMSNRKIYIYSGNNNYKIITNAKATLITDNIYQMASRKEYYECAKEAFAEMFTLLNNGKIAEPMRFTSNIILSLSFAFLINFVIVLLVSRVKPMNKKEVVEKSIVDFKISNVKGVKTGTERVYSPVSDSSSSGGGGGGGFSGGGGGGGFSGGGGGHSF